MQRNVKVCDSQTLFPQLLSLLSDDIPVPLLISGSSMSPFLIHGRDTVFLSPIKNALKVGDILLYRRDSGDYVVHRICKVTKNGFWLVGDAQTQIEKGIRPDQALAVVTAVDRKGKRLKKGSFWWFFFEKLWVRMIPLRPLAIRLMASRP